MIHTVRIVSVAGWDRSDIRLVLGCVEQMWKKSFFEVYQFKALGNEANEKGRKQKESLKVIGPVVMDFDAHTDLIFHQMMLIVQFFLNKHTVITLQVVKHDNGRSFKFVFIDSQLIWKC